MRTRKKRKIGRNLENKICKRYKKRHNRVDSKKYAPKVEKTAQKKKRRKQNKQKMVHTDDNEKKKDNKEVKKKCSRSEIFISNVFLPEERIHKEMTNQDTQGISKT